MCPGFLRTLCTQPTVEADHAHSQRRRAELGNRDKGVFMRKVIHTDEAPKAVGPYSQAIGAGGFVFTSGQIALDPFTGKLVKGGIREQARQVMENLKAVLEAANTSFPRVVKTTVFLKDMNDFIHFNEVYAEYFPSEQPARSTFQVAALPLGAMVEIEMTALAEE
jgi:2-iminobutanoate/2-iminopropanoate deaminase